MANPVTDKLSGESSWQPDADANDSNRPQNTDRMAVSSSTSITGEFRRIKSEVRTHSLDPGWIDFAGCNDARICPSPTAASWVSETAFQLNGRWNDVDAVTEKGADVTTDYLIGLPDGASLYNTFPPIAVPGRRVRVTLADDQRVAATILTSTYDAGTDKTTVTLDDNICGDGSAGFLITKVEFSSIHPYAAMSNHPLQPVLEDGVWVLPQSQGGTGDANGTPFGVDMGGDLTGTSDNCTIQSLIGVPTAIAAVAAKQVLAITNDGVGFANRNLSDLLITAYDRNEDTSAINPPARQLPHGYFKLLSLPNAEAMIIEWFVLEYDGTLTAGDSATILIDNAWVTSWMNSVPDVVWATPVDAPALGVAVQKTLGAPGSWNIIFRNNGADPIVAYGAMVIGLGLVAAP